MAWDPLAPGVVIDHAEGAELGIASNHADVDHWWSRFGVTMDDFRAGVARLLQKEEEPSMTREEVTQMVKQALGEDRKARTFPKLADVPDWGCGDSTEACEAGCAAGRRAGAQSEL